MRRWLLVMLVIGIVGAGLGCASEKRGTNDAPIDVRLQDDQAPFIVNMPDTFMNLALKCLGADLVISHTRAAAPVVVTGADVCAEGAENDIPRVDVNVD